MSVESKTIGDWCTLYHADNAELLDVLRAHEPDAVITDPPYGIGLHNAGYRRKTGAYNAKGSAEERRGNTRIVGDKEGADLPPWFDWPQVIIWGADHLRAQLPPGGRFMVWDKIVGRAPWDSFSDAELAWHSTGGKVTIFSYLWKGLVSRNSHGDSGFRIHPTQKPIAVMEWCIEQCGLEPGALILDPYMGSGTTAVAAFKRRMRFVGVEVEERWSKAAAERIKRQTGNGPLFDPEWHDAEPETMSLLGLP